ncbi:MAG: urease accessory protein [Bacteroidota bacterium]
MTIAPLLFAAVIGFNHAFEIDHMLAVGNIANTRTRMIHALRDGIFWGLGHTSTIFFVGCIILLGKITFQISNFEYLEIIVGITMIWIGFSRLNQLLKSKKQIAVNVNSGKAHNHKMAYSIGLIHGLAGSGAVVLLAMTEISSSSMSIAYLLLFGFGSIAGMMVVAGLFNLPIRNEFIAKSKIQLVFVGISAVLCIGYGAWLAFSFLV